MTIPDVILQRRSMRHLRHDLERVRLLCELIRKREQRKRELIVNKSQITALRCAPLAYFMGNVLDCLRDVDTQVRPEQIGKS